MSIDDVTPPEGDSVVINRNGAVIASVETLLRWTDDWLKVTEFRSMLGKNKKRRDR